MNLKLKYNSSLNNSFEDPELQVINDLAEVSADEPESDIYYYHSDHLGSSSWITDASGDVNQHLQYLPFGEDYIYQRTNSWNIPYTFSGKEKDAETGYSYFGARYYDSDISVWLSVDPLSDARPTISPYNYVQWNPLNRIDADGMLDKEKRIKQRFERKFNRWVNKHADELKNDVKAARYEKFRNSTTFFGKKRGDKRWFKNYENITRTSPTTNWTNTTNVNRQQITTTVNSDGSGHGSLDMVYDIQATEGELQITYDMLTLPDRMQIFDAESGKKIYDTRRKVRGRGNMTVNFNLKDNNTKIRVVINKGRTSNEQTIFKYSINVVGYRPKDSAGTGEIKKSVPIIK